MSFENSSGRNVHTQYGTRDTGTSVGIEPGHDSIHQLSIEFTGASLADTFLPPVVIPAGAHFLRYIVRIDEAFVVTGTTPTLIFGGTAPATNGVTISETELETVGTHILAAQGQGTWATNSANGTTAAEKVTKTIGGTGSPAIAATQGQGTLIAEYVYKNRTVS